MDGSRECIEVVAFSVCCAKRSIQVPSSKDRKSPPTKEKRRQPKKGVKKRATHSSACPHIAIIFFEQLPKSRQLWEIVYVSRIEIDR